MEKIMGNILATNIIESEDEIFTLSHRIITGKNLIHKTPNKVTQLLFNECTFEDSFYISNCLLKDGLIFSNCTFKKSCVFRGFTTKDYSTNYIEEGCQGLLIFDCCDFNDLRFTLNCKIDKGITINNKSKIQNLIIDTLECKDGGINFEDVNIHNQFAVNDCKCKLDFIIDKSTIESQVRMSDFKFDSVTFTHSSFEKDIFLRGGETSLGIRLNENVCNDEVKILAVKSNGCLSLIGNTFRKEVNVKYQNLQYECGICKEVNIESSIFGDTFIFDSEWQTIDKLTLKASNRLSGTINFTHCNIKTALISGDNHQANFIFKYQNIEKLYFAGFSNYGNITFSNLSSTGNEQSILSIDDSNLGKANIYSTDLSTFKKVIIHDSIIREIATSNVVWFKYSQLHVKEVGAYNNPKVKREVYRQLKYAMEQQGERIEALEFKRYEMIEYRNELKGSELTNWEIVGNKIVMFLNRSNSYGLNWIKPSFLALLFTTIFYWLITISGESSLSINLASNYKELSNSFTIFKDNLTQIILLLNPIHSIEKVLNKDEKITFWVQFWDFCQRIVLAYLIFQIISAFRKYIK